MAVPNRLAREGEDLVVYRFPTGSLGLASRADLERQYSRPTERRGWWRTVQDWINPPATTSVCAVCIPPGARLWLRDIPVRLRREGGEAEEVVFTQLTAASHMYRDAVRFAGGRVLRLQELAMGQRVRVLDLSCAEERAPINLEAEFAAHWRR